MANENQLDQGPGVPPQAVEKAKRGATHARKAAEEVWDDALHRVQSFQDDTKEYVRENPTKAVFTALGVGFVLGLIFRR